MKYKNETGYTLMGVLLVFAIISVLGLSLVTLSVASIKTSTTERQNQSAYYIAEAGITYQTEKIKKEIQIAEDRILSEFAFLDADENATGDDYFDKIERELKKLHDKFIKTEKFTEEYNLFEPINDVQPRAEFDITEADKANEYTLKSTGYIDDESRTVRTTFEIGWNLELEEKEKEPEEPTPAELPPFAVFTSGTFKMDNGTIHGDIGTTSRQTGAISFPGGGPSHNGTIYVPDGNRSIVSNEATGNIHSDIKKIDEEYTIPRLPEFPKIPNHYTKLPDQKIKSNDGHNETDLIKNNNLYVTNWITENYTLEMEENLEFNSINLNNNNTLYINVGETDKEIVVNKLNMVNGHIQLKGTGKLTMYVRNEIVMGSGSEMSHKKNINRLNVFYDGNNALNLAGDQKIFGSLYAKQAELYLTGSGGIYGNIFTGGNKIKMDGGSDIESQLILAPNANVEVMAGGEIKGKVISESFTMSGGGNVVLEEPFILDGPISPSALGGGNSGSDGSGGQPGSGGSGTGGGVKLIGADLNMIISPVREE